jgi:hypothetical protein
MSLVPLTLGIFLLFLSIRPIITYGAAGFVILALGGVVLGVSVCFVMWKASLLKPARISFDTERIQYIENGSVKKEIRWDDKTVIGPQFNHALGYNAYYGFSISRGKTTIVASPDEGWPLGKLKSAIWVLLLIAIEKDVKISKNFKLIGWIAREGQVA